MDEQQFPMTVWCGGRNAGQDVSIRLVPSELEVDNLRSREPFAVLKVHSTRLNEHSNYFQACLSERWTHPDANLSPPSLEFCLELIHGMQVATYTDCFSRMYKPLRKNLEDVKSSLELLRVASQIDFHKLVDSICRYLSTIPWSEEDELRIRHFSSSPEFPRSEAGGLVARLEIGDDGNEDSRKKLLSDQIAHSLRIALRQDDCVHRERFLSAQSFFEDLFYYIRQSEIDSAFEDDVVTIVTKEVKEMLQSFHEECRKYAIYDDFWEETSVSIKIEDDHVSDFRRKLKALCWALELLLKTQVAEEVIEYLLHLELFVAIILAAETTDFSQPAFKNVALRFCKVMIFIFEEVVAGGLLLEIPDRVLLIERWQGLDCIFYLDTESENLVPGEFRKALEGVFLTLPLQQQLELLQRSTIFSQRFICRNSLIALMKRNWPAAQEDALLQADANVEVEGGVSDSIDT